MPSPLAILSAIPPELTPLRSLLTEATTADMAGRPASRGRLDGVEVVLAEAGVGKVNTAVAATLLVERFGCRAIVFTGVAGGLDPSLSVGDVVVAEQTVPHDTGVLQEDGLHLYQPGYVPFFNPTDRFGYFPSPQLLERVRARLTDLSLEPVDLGGPAPRVPRVVLGTLLSGDQFLDSATHRNHLHAELGGQAVEMEGAALAQAAETLGVDHLVVRALSDLAGGGASVDFNRLLPAVAGTSMRVVRHLLPVL